MENALATGRFQVLCYDKDGNLKWKEDNSNLVVNAGVVYMAGTALTSVTQITSWYIGLVTGPGSGTTFSIGDTMASHGATGSGGWSEFTSYSILGGSTANRGAPSFTNTSDTAGGNNKSIVTNSSAVAFTITSGGTVAGAFLTSVQAKSPGTTGTLFSASDFTGGDRTVVTNDTLNVTYTFTLTGT
jgi:hypothetical protein